MEMADFGHNYGKGLGKRAWNPTQLFCGYHPSGSWDSPVHWEYNEDMKSKISPSK